MIDYEQYQPESAEGFLDVPGVTNQAMSLLPRKRAFGLYLFLLLPCVWAGASWMGGGIPFLTDLAFSMLLVICAILVLVEVIAFSRRFGLGGILVFGGSLVWYVQDYFAHWFQADFRGSFKGYTAVVVAKGAFFTSLFVFSAAMGLFLPPSRKVINATLKIPQPRANNAYVIAIIATLVVGMIPYVFFTKESLPITLWKAMTAMRTGNGPEFTTGRTGNYNYSWGGYLAQVLQIGSTGGVLAAFYVLMLPGKGPSKWLCTLIWAFWSALAFGSGSRGVFLFSVLPVAVLLFLKYMLVAAERLRRFSPRAVLYSALFLFFVLFVVQIQGSFRNSGLEGADILGNDIFKNQGNAMFSEGLLGYEYFGESFPFSADTFPGATFIRPIPDVIIRFAISWFPRVLWHNKPGIDETGQWYDRMISGGTAANTSENSGQVKGGTIAPSIAGIAYIKYGFAGVIQTGLLFGWLCRMTEEILWINLRRPLGVMFALGLSAWLFRDFRDLTPHDLYPLLIGMGFIVITIKMLQMGGDPLPEQHLPAGEYA